MVTKNKDDWVNVRVTSEVKSQILELVDAGKYEDLATFIREAIADKIDPSRKEDEITRMIEQILREKPDVLGDAAQRLGFVKR